MKRRGAALAPRGADGADDNINALFIKIAASRAAHL